jgi:ADP-ribosylglycohydrolase
MAAGDALGTALEFRPPGSFTPIENMVGGGPFGLRAGEWTDDTSMALCLAESLIETGRFDPADQLKRYLRWWREGHLSSTGECFDIARRSPVPGSRRSSISQRRKSCSPTRISSRLKSATAGSRRQT